MTLQELANKVCGHLPEGYIINIRLDSECESVTLQEPNGVIRFIDSGGETLEWQVNEALCMAQVIMYYHM